jgi:hypothetical protein
MDWAECKNAFSYDGSLRDIYVLDTNTDDWNKFLRLLVRKSFDLTFLIDGKNDLLPSDAASIFKIRSEHNPMLSFDLGGMVLNCYFFCVDEIEIDIDPEEVTDELRFHLITSFMQDLTTVLGKPTILTPENTPELELFRATPDGDIAFYAANFPAQ